MIGQTSFLKDCLKVIQDIPTYALEEHKTTGWGQRAAFQRAKKDAEKMGCIGVSKREYESDLIKLLESRSRAQNRTVKLLFKEDFVLTYLNKLSKDEAVVDRLLNMYIESEEATFKALVEEESFKEYFSHSRENENE